MNEEVWAVGEIEAEYLHGLWRQFQVAERELKLAFSMLCASKGLRNASLVGVEGNRITVGVPLPSDGA